MTYISPILQATLSTQDACNALGISASSLRRLRKEHKIAAFRHGKNWRYTIDSIETYALSLIERANRGIS